MRIIPGPEQLLRLEVTDFDRGMMSEDRLLFLFLIFVFFIFVLVRF